jgi:phosphatidate cytidylyltransferase
MKSFFLDPQMETLGAGIFGLLLVASIVGFVLNKTVKGQQQQEVVLNLNARINAWWVMIIIFFLAMATGGIGSVVLFGLTSLLCGNTLL